RRSQKMARRARGGCRAALCLASAAAAWHAFAAEKDWNPTVSSGNWTTPGNWLQNAPPADQDDVVITNTPDAGDHNVTYDYTGPTIVLDSVRIENIGTGTNTLTQTLGTLSINDILYLGNAPSSSGAYSL